MELGTIILIVAGVIGVIILVIGLLFFLNVFGAARKGNRLLKWQIRKEQRAGVPKRVKRKNRK